MHIRFNYRWGKLADNLKFFFVFWNASLFFLSAFSDCAQSFMCTILESQYTNELFHPDGSLTSFGSALDHINLFFTIIFSAELVVLAFSNWFVPFISDPWCWLDMFVVSMSLVSLVVTNEPTGVARVMRALRVLRLFGRLKSLRKILFAIALAIVPVCQVFVILFILLCIGTQQRTRVARITRAVAPRVLFAMCAICSDTATGGIAGG